MYYSSYSFSFSKIWVTHNLFFQRVDIEGEDALNILSCLVERSVEFEEKSQHNIDITASVNTLKKISQEYDDNHQMRNDAIDELVRAHTYAMEMKQAALSASTWLRTIDRNSQRNSNNYNANMNNDLKTAKLEAILADKIEQNERLNQELSKCRAEIGRLRSVSKADVSVQRSVYFFLLIPLYNSPLFLLK